MATQPEPAPPGFTRTLVKVQFRTIIRSQCDYCGLQMVGSVTETLREDELAHREFCPNRKSAERTAAGS